MSPEPPAFEPGPETAPGGGSNASFRVPSASGRCAASRRSTALRTSCCTGGDRLSSSVTRSHSGMRLRRTHGRRSSSR